MSADSKPATMRSAVVLPQPDGPSSATSSPGAILTDSPSSARVTPKARVRSRSSTLVPPPRPACPAMTFPFRNDPIWIAVSGMVPLIRASAVA